MEGGRGGCQEEEEAEEEASHAFCTDKALDAATSAGTRRREEAAWSSPERPLTVLRERSV